MKKKVKKKKKGKLIVISFITFLPLHITGGNRIANELNRIELDLLICEHKFGLELVESKN